jgi:tetratricopeptide (TPR) repeat protein
VLAGLPTSQRAPVCDEADTAIARVWGISERVEIASTFGALPLPIAGDLERNVLAGLDARASTWAATRHGACLAHLHAEQSDALFDRKMLCLDRQLGDLTAAVGVLQHVDTERATDATQVVAGIPAASRCDDAASLMDAPAPPSTPAADVEVERIRAEISQAAALDHGGQSDEALELAKNATKAAEATGYQPIVAEAALEVGRVLIARQQYEPAVSFLQSARREALASGRQARVAVEAGARLMYVEGAIKPDVDRLARDLQYLEPMAAALSTDHFVRPLLYNNAAEVYIMAQHPDDARRYLDLARDAAGDAPDIELTAIDRNLALLTKDPAERERLARSAWQRTRDVLGEHNIRTLWTQGIIAIFESDPHRADELLGPVCDEYLAVHPKLVDTLLECEVVRAFVADEAGHRREAEQAYEAMIGAATRPDQAVIRLLATAELAALRGDGAHAASAFREVIAQAGSRDDWWERQRAYQAELGLARIALAEHRPSEAAGELDVAAAGYETIAKTNPGIMYERRAEIAKRLRARLREFPERPEATTHKGEQ